MKMYRIMLFFLVFLCSCQKYLDIKTQSTQSFIETAQDCQLILDNYVTMNTGYPTDGEASAGDYYMNDNRYLSSTLNQDDRSIYIWSNTAVRNDASKQWKPCYFIIYNSNLVLEALDKLKGGATDAATIEALRGAALFYRAFSLWQIAQLYAKPYSASTANQDPGVPIRLNSDINGKSSRGTVQDTYDSIIKDLKEAESLLPNTSPIASRPNKAAADAMLARVYLSMENYSQAQVYADAAIKIKSDLIDYNTLSKTATIPFNPRFNKEVIFQSVTTMTYLLYPGSSGFNFAMIDRNLVASYAINDLRKNIFFKTVSGTPTNYYFSGNYEPTNGGTFFNGLAVDELYLIRAECYARSGDISLAMADLNSLLRTRWTTGTYVDMTSNNVDEALSIILNERRKELLMRGLRWTDLRRLNKDNRFAITLSRTVQGVTYVLSPNDLRYTLLIPNEVIQNAQIAQNPR